MRRNPRKPSEYLRVLDDGTRERRCLSCEVFFPENKTHFTTTYCKGKRCFAARCRPCNSLYRQASQRSHPLAPDLPPSPAPPVLTWDALLRGIA